MTVARRCAGCGAALGEPTDDDLTIVCGFCGLRHDINDLAAAASPVVVQVTPRTSRAGLTIGLVVLAIAAATTAGGLYVAYRAAQTTATFVADTTASVRPPTGSRDRRLPLVELAALSEFGWKFIDAPAPPGGFAAFDPVAAVPWAMDIARAWAPDAMLTRIDVGDVSATGVVDLTGDAPSGYRFRSPARRQRWTQETDSGSKSTTASGLTLQLHDGAVRAIVDADRRDEPTTPAPVSLALPALLERARRGRGFSDRPFYAGYMIHLPREGWAWYFRAPSGDSFPRVRARDGRVYPY